MIPSVRERFRLLLVLTLVLVILATQWPYASYAENDLQRIRVGLMFDNLKTIRDTSPEITISSKDGIEAGLVDSRLPEGRSVFVRNEGSTVMRFRLMQWSVLVWETDAPDLALKKAAKLQAIGEPFAVIVRKRADETDPNVTKLSYQIETGPYVDEGIAKSAIKKMKSVLSDVPSTESNWQLIGQHYAIIGTYSDELTSKEALATVEKAGWNPLYLRSTTVDGQPIWRIAIGGAANAISLATLQEKYLALTPSAEWEIWNWADEMVIAEREEWIADSGEAGGHIELQWLIPADKPVKAWIQSIGDRLTLTEHNKATYRGRLELFSVNDKMAVVNDVLLDDYIASLLGAEMSGTWPMEALKAQALTARTFALKQANKYGFAQVSDTTYDQVYKGTSSESARTIQAAKETSGEVLVTSTGLIGAYFYSNAGGKTASVEEVWSGNCEVCKSVDSFDDSAQTNKPLWGRIVTTTGVTGYAPMSALVSANRSNSHQYPLYTVTTNSTSVRGTTYVDTNTNPAIATLRTGDQVYLLETAFEVNAYSWLTAPVTASALQKTMNSKLSTSAQLKQPIQTVSVSKRGTSGRVTEIQVNGTSLKNGVPDNYRGLLGGLRSTLFDIDQMGQFTILSANQKKMQAETAPATKWYAIGSNGKVVEMTSGPVDRLVQNNALATRVLSLQPKFRFIGNGYGHGVGLSQWGAKQLAEQGWTYDRIVLHFYPGATIRKDVLSLAR